MTDTDHDIKATFAEGPDLATDAERAAYLHRARAGSHGVPARVEALFAAIGQAGSFLEALALVREACRERRAHAGQPPLATSLDPVGAPVGIEATVDLSGLWPITEDLGTDIGPSDVAVRATPTRLGDFELVRRLGEGAMGVVFEARQVSLNRPVAIKMIRAGLFAGEADLRRFRVETEAVAHLDHPRIVPIYGVGEDQDCHYFSMKLVRGGSLARRLSAYPADPRAAARLVADVAQAIQHAHDRGILHRDLKPSNILLDDEDRPLVTDFGLAKRAGDNSSLTHSGAIVGTPNYMAPEQATGDKVAITAVTDVYGLGAVLYALLTGRPPFVADTILATIEQVRGRPPAPPSRINPRVGRDLETICLRCLEKDPWRRYASADALADDLRRWLDGAPIAARPVSAAARVWMWSRRNRIVTGLLAGLLLFALGTTWQWWRAEGLLLQARRDASSETIDHALSICAQGDIGRGMLRLAEALETAPPDASDLKQAVRANLVAWSRHQTQLTNLLRHSDRVHFVGFSPDGRTAVTASPDGTARLWDAFTSEPRGAPLRHDGGVMQAAFSPDSRRLITASLDRTARLWEVDGGKPLGVPLRHRGPVRSVAFSPDGRTVLTGSNDGAAQIWEVASQRPVGEPLRHKGWVQQVLFRPDGNAAITAGQLDNTVRLWDLRTGQVIGAPMPYQPGRRDNRAASFFVCSADGDLILTTGTWLLGQKACAQAWDATNGRPLGASLCHDDGIRAVGLSRIGHVAITGSDDRTARVWDARTGTSLGGRTILMGHTDGTAQVRDAATMQPLGPPLRHDYAILSVAISPDGTRLLTGCVDGTVHVWSARTREPIGRPLYHTGPVHSVAFSPDGRMVLTGSGDRTARIWDTATGKPIGMPLAHNAGVAVVAFGVKGDAVLTKTEDGIVRRWKRPADAWGPDERFVLWAQVAIGAEIDANGTVRGLDASAWQQKRNQLRSLGGVPRP